MKKILITLGCCMAFHLLFAQQNVSELFDLMQNTCDQFNDLFDPSSVEDQLTIIYIPGSNDPFAKVYDKHKGKKLVSNTQFIGGFKEMMAGVPEKKRRSTCRKPFGFVMAKTTSPYCLTWKARLLHYWISRAIRFLKCRKKAGEL